MKYPTLIVLSLLGLATLSARAQSLASRIGAVRDGTVRLTYASQPDVCGNGSNSIRTGDHNHHIRNGRDDDDSHCDYGPVRLSLVMSQGIVSRIRVAVGGRWRPAGESTVDLGLVSVKEVSSYLLDLAQRSRSNVGGEAIFAITIADSIEPWGDLLRLARDEDVRRDTRKSAVFWLGQAAGDVATRGLTELAEDEAEDREVRESAVFALSQLRNDEGVPILIRIARSNRDPKIRRMALFWLGQSDDPRALQLFEELLASD